MKFLSHTNKFPYQRYRFISASFHFLFKNAINWSIIAFILFCCLPLLIHFSYQWSILNDAENKYKSYVTTSTSNKKSLQTSTPQGSDNRNTVITNDLNNANGIINSVNNNAGFITGIIGIILVSYSLIYQARNTKKNGFKESYFHFLSIHRENLEQVTTKGKKGHDAFIAMYNEMQEIIPVVQNSLPSLAKQKLLGVAYLAFFWGVGKTSTPILKESLTRHYALDNDTLNNLIQNLETLQDDRNTEIKNAANDTEKKRLLSCLLDGHQSDLGHYFRHLYQTVKFISNESSLWMHEKYEYGKTLRAQFSNHEQAIFFFNANSPLGKNWEPKKGDYKKRFISYYALIKNMPPSLIPLIDVRTLFPTIKFEFDDSNK